MSEGFEDVEEAPPLTEEDCERRVAVQRAWFTTPPEQSSDWKKLSADQQADVTSLRASMRDVLITVTEDFYRLHPELRLIWSFAIEAQLRENEEQS